MFTISTAYGTCPYDGFRVYSPRWPRPEFIQEAQQLRDVAERRGERWDDEPGWKDFISLPVNGAPGALRVGWGPLRIGRGMPKTMIILNPSTAGLDPNETLALLRWVVDDADQQQLEQLATKLDFEGTVRELDARLYLPRVRAKNVQYGDETHYHGSMQGATRLKSYDKGKQTGGVADQVARVEMTERFKNVKARPGHNAERRPTMLEFLRGELVAQNKLRKVAVVDLAAVGDQDLTDLALEVGLTEAMRLAPLPTGGTRGWNRGANMGWLRRQINANADKDLLFNLYQQQATAWHSQFDVATAAALTLSWSDDLGIDVNHR